MKTFIPHKGNPNIGRKILGATTIVLFSVIFTYFGGSYAKEYVVRANAVGSQEVTTTQTQVEEIDAVTSDIKEEEINEYKNENIPTPINDNETLATTIEEAKLTIPIIRDKDPKKRLEEAKIYAKPQIIEGKYIDISLAHQNMVLFENGQFVDSYLVSSGKKGMDTPIGTFKIENKASRAWSKKYGLYMPNWMAIEPNGKYGIHELPEWPGGYKEGANHLGIAVSHGCVRLGEGAAKRVYDWSDIGTPVIIHK